MSFSIAIVTYQRKERLQECLSSMWEALEDHQSELDGVYIFLNGHDLETQGWLKNCAQVHLSVSSVPLSPAEARNRLAQKAKGDYILFIDDDVIFPKDYFSKALQVLSCGKKIDVFGGPDQCPKPAVNRIQRLFSEAIESWDVTGPTFRRHRHSQKSNLIKGNETHLILCHMWFRLDLFRKGKYRFDASFSRNEENDLLLELEREGLQIWYDADLFIYHQRKSSLRSIVKAYWTSGRYRFLCLMKRGGRSNTIYFLPLSLLFLFSLFMGIEGGVLLFSCYMLLNSSMSLKSLLQKRGTLRQKLSDWMPLVGMKILIHFSYMSGQIFQMARSLAGLFPHRKVKKSLPFRSSPPF